MTKFLPKLEIVRKYGDDEMTAMGKSALQSSGDIPDAPPSRDGAL
jgi:hypothetical protein